MSKFDKPKIIPPQEKILEKEKQFEQYVQKGIELSLEKIKKRFENDSEEENNLEFHNTAHTEGVVRRIELIMKVLQESNPEIVQKRDVNLAKLAASFHDVVQKWEAAQTKDGEFTKTVRRRFIGANETASSQEVVEFMEEVNKEKSLEIFSIEDKQRLIEAIDATVPGFSVEKGTVIQPNMKESSGIIAKALALADIGTAGMEGSEAFLPEGDALFREENLDIAQALRENHELSETQKEYFRKRMLLWTKFQANFALGRKNLLETELLGLSENAQIKLKELFNKFDSSIEASRERALRRENMSFEELLSDMGYVYK